MSIHNPERPDAPARVRKSALRPDRWAWRCMDKPTHHESGYPSWDDAWAAMEKHRWSEHHTPFRERAGDGCSCFVVPDPWTHYGATEPGGALEFDPGCPKHAIPHEVTA